MKIDHPEAICKLYTYNTDAHKYQCTTCGKLYERQTGPFNRGIWNHIETKHFDELWDADCQLSNEYYVERVQARFINAV